MDSDSDPLWAKALASPECEYWIAGAREEIQSLENLNVFVLVLRFAVLCDQQPLRGKLVCKRKHNDAGNIVCYKVRYVAKGYTSGKHSLPFSCLSGLLKNKKDKKVLKEQKSSDKKLQNYKVKVARFFLMHAMFLVLTTTIPPPQRHASSPSVLFFTSALP
jgi:hypothetical protein